MLLENPARARAIVANGSIPQRLASLNRQIASRNKADADLIDGLRRILESPNPQAERLRQLIKEVDLAVKLLEIQPTTIAGTAALLTYYVDVVTTTQPEVAFPEVDGNGRPFESESDEPRRDFGYFMVRNVAAALRNMAAACEVSEQHGADAHRQQGSAPHRR